MMPESPRFEFRCWPGHSVSLMRAAENRYEFGDPEIRTDSYLRGGELLDIKACHGWHGHLELWQREFSSHFPLDKHEQRRICGIFPSVALLGLPFASPDDALRRLNRIVRQRDVCKARQLFRDGDFQAELTSATCDGVRCWTIAFECPDATRLEREIATLSLGHFDNMNYGAALKHPDVFGGVAA